ncbi:MAG: hypothetical protein ABJO36_12785 [Litorimonas sp.]
MINNIEASRVSRRQTLSFVFMALRPLLKLTVVSLFRPEKMKVLSTAFSELYSRLWDFAEHSISHHGFTLPSALGETPSHRVNGLLSKLYGAPFASLSFGGSSGALLTLLTAIVPKLHPNRDLILFDDVCHQSAIGGLIFGRWKAIRLERRTTPTLGTVSPVSFEAVKKAIELHGPDRFAAILLVLPSYDGFRSPSEDIKIYNYAKSHGIFVIVDGAWDALRFRHPNSKTPPLSSICDVWVTSPHKRGLTPSSLGCILTKSEAIARLWDEALDLGFRSSSVSFVEIMIAEHRLEQIVRGEWNKAFEQAECAGKILSDRIHEIHPNLHIVKPHDVQAETHDQTHVLISVDRVSDLDGRRWAETLSQHFAIDVEKATSSTLLLLCGSPSHLTQMDNIILLLKKALNMTLKQKECRPHD